MGLQSACLCGFPHFPNVNFSKTLQLPSTAARIKFTHSDMCVGGTRCTWCTTRRHACQRRKWSLHIASDHPSTTKGWAAWRQPPPAMHLHIMNFYLIATCMCVCHMLLHMNLTMNMWLSSVVPRTHAYTSIRVHECVWVSATYTCLHVHMYVAFVYFLCCQRCVLYMQWFNFARNCAVAGNNQITAYTHSHSHTQSAVAVGSWQHDMLLWQFPVFLLIWCVSRLST